jgi:hypothetical protein
METVEIIEELEREGERYENAVYNIAAELDKLIAAKVEATLRLTGFMAGMGTWFFTDKSGETISYDDSNRYGLRELCVTLATETLSGQELGTYCKDYTKGGKEAES